MSGNAAVALAVLRELGAVDPRLLATDDAIRRGFASARWPGRLEVVRRSPLVVCDGAHNREAAASLAASLPSLVGDEPVRLIFGALRDKPWREMAAELRPLVTEVALVPVRSPRSAAPAEVATAFSGVRTDFYESAEAALAALVEQDSATPIVVAGSLFLLGEIYAGLLRGQPGASVFSARWEGRI
jgi:dihydrofolate synthase / folylpolyglutamate synthase